LITISRTGVVHLAKEAKKLQVEGSYDPDFTITIPINQQEMEKLKQGASIRRKLKKVKGKSDRIALVQSEKEKLLVRTEYKDPMVTLFKIGQG